MVTRNMTVPISNSGPLDEKFDKVVKETLEQWHVPGVSVAVIDGEHTWSKGYGIATFPSTPVTPSTLFYTGSTTKAFTAAIMTFLVDNNSKYPHIQLTTPIADLIRDDFVLENDYATTHTTILDALSHRSGLPRHDNSYGFPGCTVKDIVHSLRHLPLTAEPRTKYQYCNVMFVAASHVIEVVTGRNLGDLMREWIWEPLGMEATFFDLSSAKAAKEDLARGYLWRYDREGGFEPVDWINLSEGAGAGAVISNVLDYAKWARALIEHKTPLSKEGVKAMLTPRILMPIEEPFTGPRAYAMGWRTGVYRGEWFFGHSGGVTGFGADFMIFPESKFAVVVLANTAGTSNFVGQKVVFHLVDEKLNVPVEERFDWDKRYRGMVAEGKHKAQNAKSIFYPSLPSPPLPHALPLSSYVGTYHHPAYQTLTIVLAAAGEASGKQLIADRKDVTWPQKLTFEHVSGEFFVVSSQNVEDLGALFANVYPAEFKIGVDGRVSEVGIGWEEEMLGQSEDKIWLKRVME